MLVGDDGSLEDVTELVKVAAHFRGLRLPSQPSDEHLGEGGVAELPPEIMIICGHGQPGVTA